VPEVLSIETAVWDLSVWTRDIESPAKRLALTLGARSRPLPLSSIRFNPPLAVTVITPVPVPSLAENPAEITLPAPVFFENRQYEFEFRFKGDPAALQPEIIHWRTDVEDAFHHSGSGLRGNINFGNDVGWFRLGVQYLEGGGELKQSLSFEVLPVKMDMAGDFELIHKDIDSTYPLWRFSFAQKTEQELAASRKPHERFPLLWLALFRSLQTDLQKAVKLICSAPHSRLLPQERFLRPDRLKGRLTPRLEEQVAEQCRIGEPHRRHRVETRRLSVDTPENRFVKMVLDRSARELTGFASKARQNDAEQGRLSQAFFAELESWKKPLKQRLAEPLFREVGDFAGMAQESLVLHHRAGYAKVYRIWQELKLYLDLLCRQASISMKSVSELYEVWCLLEIRRMLMGLGFIEVETRKADLRNKGVEKDLVDGIGTAFRFTRRDGLKIRLAHEPCFSSKNNSGIFSFTTSQKPDILLEATFPDKSRIRWIFDAKYRIDSEDGKGDLIPDDAINQMHRYRDALIHLKKADDGVTEKSRPIVGAFVLYPGWFDETAEANPYNSAIETVGIGGFPLLPGRDNLWLRAFLQEKFGDLSEEDSKERALEPDEHLLHESVRIAPTGLQLKRYDDLTVAASLGNVSKRDKLYVDRFMTGNAGWYHMPVSTSEKKKYSRTIMREIRCCAVAVHHAGTHERLIEYLYDVRSVRLVKRCDLYLEQAGSVDPDNQQLYWLFELGASRQLNSPVRISGTRHFPVRLTGMPDLLAAENWSDLPERYAAILAR